METVPLADQSCHRAGIPKNDSGGGVYLSRWPPSVTTVVQQLPNANDPVVLPPPCQAPSTSTAETGRPLHSQRMANDPVALPSLRAAPALSTDEQRLLPAPRKKKVSPRCRHFHGCGPPLPNVDVRSEPGASALLRYRKARRSWVSALKSTNRGPYTATLAPGCPPKNSRLRGGGWHPDRSPTEKTAVSLPPSNDADVGLKVVVPRPRGNAVVNRHHETSSIMW
ncbi:uncharacterized protein [Dermacentor andersoni]|uniref:uncharacterized protein n=1 Tax=Dermacentor andersoni TaxID=34620 RepID=UPI003B3AE4DF